MESDLELPHSTIPSLFADVIKASTPKLEWFGLKLHYRRHSLLHCALTKYADAGKTVQPSSSSSFLILSTQVSSVPVVIDCPRLQIQPSYCRRKQKFSPDIQPKSYLSVLSFVKTGLIASGQDTNEEQKHLFSC